MRLSIIVILFCCSCSAKSKKEMVDSKKNVNNVCRIATYKTKIETIFTKVIDLTSYSDLLQINEFNELFSNSNLYYDCYKQFVIENKDLNHGIIAVLSMQNLEKEIYFSICDDLLNLSKDNAYYLKLSKVALFDFLKSKNHISDNMQSNAVKALFRKYHIISK